MAGPTDQEQYQLELLNDFRLNPLADTARYITSYSPLVATQADIQSALNYFGVSGSALLSQLAALTPAQPVAWSEILASSALGHDQQMIAADTQSHQLPGEPDLQDRATAAGYNNWSNLGENVYAYSDSPLYAQAGFVVDWGPGATGMQDPAGHRENMIDPNFREVGIAILPDTNPGAQDGPQVETEDFGSRFSGSSFVLGVAYHDTNGDDFYEPGEETPGLTVSLAGTTVGNWASGGYTLETFATGAQTVSFNGGGLAGTVTAAITLASQSDVKIDIVNGTELKTSASAVVSGPISSIEGLGLQGLTLAATGSGAHAISGSGGGDNILGGSGADYIRGLDGNDTIDGGAGNDDVNGNMGNDIVHGGDGNDSVRGGQGNDTVYGDAGDDPHVNGNLGDDIVHGGDGNDTVYGGQGNDTIYGDNGNDQLSGDLGNDVMYGGSGADRFMFQHGGGQDQIGDFSSAEGDRVVLPTGTAYTLETVNGQAVIDLGGGDTLTLVGVSQAQMGDWLVYA